MLRFQKQGTTYSPNVLKIHHFFLSISAQCSNNVFNDLSNVIKTPEYPDAYPGYSDCDWTVSVAEGYVIELVFNDFEIEDHPDGGCPYDSLMVGRLLCLIYVLLRKKCKS